MLSKTQIKWAKQLLFIGLCLFGVASLAYGLLPRNRIETPSSFRPRRAEQPDFQEVVNRVNADFEAHWKKEGLNPTPPADRFTVVRRLSLGLTGTIPSLEEIRALERVPEDQRVEWWVSRILEDRRYADFVAERLARAYIGTENGPFIIFRRRRFVTWLSDRLFQNDTPYDELVRKLISGSGLWTDKPQVNFLTVAADQTKENRPDPIRLGGRTVRAFLGMRIDCLQCHDEFRTEGVTQFPGADGEMRGGTQQDFHGIAAYFAQLEPSIQGMRDNPARFYEYKYLYEDEEEIVRPQPPYLPELEGKQKSRRQQLATWVTHPENKPFARAMVNRMWAIMVGKPLHKPIDNIPINGSDAPGLEILTDDFIANGFDLRRLIRLIAATRVYQLDSQADFEITSAHDDAHASFPLMLLRPEQVAGAVIQASSLKTIDAEAFIISQLAKFNETQEFVTRYGDLGEDEFDERSATLSQRLLMMNGQLVKQRSQQGFSIASSRIATLAPDDKHAVETTFLTVLSRQPSPEELEICVARLEGKKGNARSAQLEDLFWVLFNHSDFVSNR